VASEHGFRVIRTDNRGLAAARNTGLEAASGEIVAYLDDDARPDPHWLRYLAHAFARSQHAGIGGPNVHPGGDGTVADCVASAPGGPVHVLLTDEVAEHIPGCNMAFRREALEAIGGFDPQFRVAGDDVDVCWRLQARGRTLGFSHGAMVWHHRRNSIRAYWRQQQGYGRAEALLERKWPEKYNAAGHVSWSGRVYQNGHVPGRHRWRVYYGTWGSGLFQPARPGNGSLLAALVQMPEWYLVVGALAAITAIGALWAPLLFCGPILVAAAGAVGIRSWLATAHLRHSCTTRRSRLRLQALTAFLHLLQPAARLWGRIGHGLTPWRRRATAGFALPWPATHTRWSEKWSAPADRLRALEAMLRESGAVVVAGGSCDRWDLEVRGGLLGSARLRMTAEEHGRGTQLVRFRVWPRWANAGLGIVAVLGGLASSAGLQAAYAAAGILAAVALALLAGALSESGAAMAAFARLLARERQEERPAEDLLAGLERRVPDAELRGRRGGRRAASEGA
jgi:hypothetical protein